MTSFDSIPVLDLSLARDAATKVQFLADLRKALIEVGFLYIKNVGISNELIEKVIEQGKAFFDLPRDEKLKIEMRNAPSFLGYSQLDAEITAQSVDHREQFDLSTEHPIPTPSSPLHHNLLAPNLWPSPNHLPSFRPTFIAYMAAMSTVSMFFTSLIAESIGLPSTAFDSYFDGESQQHKLKIVKYPDLKELGLDGQALGVGPHKDSMLTSYLLQASQHRGLQVQNSRGAWIDVPPIDGTLVVAIGQGLEALTQGVCASTTHRVLSPAPGSGPRFSIPFFQGVSLDAEFEGVQVPKEVKDEVARRRELNGGWKDDVEFTFRKGRWKTLGEATLMNRIKSHRDVGERWYPDLLKGIVEEEERMKRQKDQEQAVVHTQTVIPVGQTVETH